MKKAFYWIALLAALLSACNLPGVAAPAPGSPVENTQDPAADTAIAQLVLTEMATNQPGDADPALPTAGGIYPAASPQATQPASPTAGTGYPPPEEAPAPSGTPLPPATETNGPVLPAPLLFLSSANEGNQIWRLETDAKTLKQLTDEPADVVEFDVSPQDGRVAFVSANDLILINADGSSRTLLVDGPPPPAENDPQRPVLELGRPRWSPDGQTIAYRHGGVNLIPASAGSAPARLIQSDPVPTPPNYQTEKPAYNYWPESWAPDGKRLLIGYSIWPETSGLAVLSTAGGQPLPVKSVESFACCNPVWSLDGSSIYYASPFFGMILAGMWRSDAATGESQTLIKGDADDGLFYLPGFVHHATDGKLYFFYGKTDKFPEGDVMLTPVRAEADGQTGLTPLRSDSWLVGEALWAPDGRGVVILDMSAGLTAQGEWLGKAVYLKSDNSEPIPLPATGSMLRWGK